ncbi:transcription factor NF-E2 45 kDa subunit-like [Hemiscyllium ocellatum]|uniref:transcription factor NF-E2 45 kDa subunit-like n=1 Tax=Hemiscyllium ocellatum TaxID=170820 RepID=UPI0029670858|nr:transcription factor NF-E2 45 kDa subunit-like [Hemiscyllium ocellatum]
MTVGLDEDGQLSAPDPPSLYALAPCCYDPPSATPDPDPDPYAPGPWTPCGLPLPQHRRPDPCPATPGPRGPQRAVYPLVGAAGWGGWAEPASQGPRAQQPLPPQGAQAKVRGAPGSSRDERRARALRLPLAAEEIVRLPVEDFNELATRYRLTEQQLALARDIRRRGKNKVAAQSCRRRKLEAIARLEAELRGLRAERSRLAAQRSQVRGELDQARARLGQLRDSLLSSLRDPRGRPYPRGAFELRQADDGEVYLVPRAPGAAGE